MSGTLTSFVLEFTVFERLYQWTVTSLINLLMDPFESKSGFYLAPNIWGPNALYGSFSSDFYQSESLRRVLESSGRRIVALNWWKVYFLTVFLDISLPFKTVPNTVNLLQSNMRIKASSVVTWRLNRSFYNDYHTELTVLDY